MASVGQRLCAAREQQGLSVADIADRTKLRSDHVRALEEGNYDVFAAPVYVRGFVRNYAGILKLDVSAVLADLESELNSSQHLRESTQFVKPPPTLVDIVMLQMSKVKWGITLVIVGVALVLYLSILGYRAWRIHRATDPLTNLGPGLYQPADNQGGDLLPLTPPAP
ncbi:MAG: helix-turn-helix domain-containing protein [Verrucomicrobiia bacterium]